MWSIGEGYFYTSLYQMSTHCDLLTRRTARAELALEDTLIQSQHVSIMAKQTQDEDTGTHKYRLPQNIVSFL